MHRGIHGEKIVAALQSDKLPKEDVERLQTALSKYDQWISDLDNISSDSLEEKIKRMTALLNDYKYYIDVNTIFDSSSDFLYRQKGQLKLDNTIVEEFLPILVKKCISDCIEADNDIIIDSQTPTFSSVFFDSSVSIPGIGGGINIKVKDQDFSLCRKIYLRSSFDEAFSDEQTVNLETHIGYVMAEIKTNLDKTMFQEASATAHEIKQSVIGAKYFLLCEYLDMTPISTATTDIDEILILRKAKRISSNIRKAFATYNGRMSNRDWYIDYLESNPYAADVFSRFINHIRSLLTRETLIEKNVLEDGFF